MYCKPIIIVFVVCSVVAAAASATPQYNPPAGYQATPYLATLGETLIEGFDVDAAGNVYYIETTYQYFDDPIYWYLPTASALKKYTPGGSTTTLYGFDSGVYGSFVRLIGDDVWFGNSSDNVVRSISSGGGAATDIVTLAGQYDLQANGLSQVFVSAKPGTSTGIFHIYDDGLGYVADLVADIGGYSGPIEFDVNDNLYYGFPNYDAGGVVYFDASDVAAAIAEEDYGNAELGAADWTSYCASLSACSFLQFDDNGDLYSSSWQSVVDRIYAQDSSEGFGSSPNYSGLGQMAYLAGEGWGELYLAATDYSMGEYNSILYQITAIPEPSTVLMMLSGIVAGAGILARRLRR